MLYITYYLFIHVKYIHVKSNVYENCLGSISVYRDICICV